MILQVVEERCAQFASVRHSFLFLFPISSHNVPRRWLSTLPVWARTRREWARPQRTTRFCTTANGPRRSAKDINGFVLTFEIWVSCECANWKENNKKNSVSYPVLLVTAREFAQGIRGNEDPDNYRHLVHCSFDLRIGIQHSSSLLFFFRYIFSHLFWDDYYCIVMLQMEPHRPTEDGTPDPSPVRQDLKMSKILSFEFWKNTAQPLSPPTPQCWQCPSIAEKEIYGVRIPDVLWFTFPNLQPVKPNFRD